MATLTNFFLPDGKNNLPGFFEFLFIEDSQVLDLPAPINGLINLSEITYGTSEKWYYGSGTLDTLNLGTKGKITDNGSLFTVEVSGRAPLINNSNTDLFETMMGKRFILLVHDNNDKWHICGEALNGLFFEFDATAASLEFRFFGQFANAAYETTGVVTQDDSIVDTGLKVTINLNGDYFLNPPAGTTVDLLLRDQGGNEIEPASTSGSQINITLPKTLVWQLNFNGTDDVIYVEGVTGENLGTLTAGTGSNVGTITVSTDGGVTYGALGFPFTPVDDTIYYFKRSTASVNGTYKMTGTYV
jgi:hypothetical protein